MRKHTILVSALALSLAACGDGGPDSGWAGTVTDSAGVQLVTNPTSGTWAAGEGWTVEEELSIGGMAGGLVYQFGQVTGVTVDEGDTLYVVDQQAREVRVFAPDGTWLRTIGKPGSGPGEFGLGVGGVFLTGGEVRVPDIQNQRVSRFAPDGGYLGEFRLHFERGIPWRWDGPVDGRLLSQLRVLTPDAASEASAGDPVVAWADDGTMADTLIVLPPGQGVTFAGGMPQFHFFEPEPMWDAGSDGRLVSGLNHELRLEVRDPDGALRRVISLPRERQPVTERDRRVFLDGLREAMGGQGVPPEAVGMMLDRATFAEHYPAYASLMAGPEGTVWVQRFRTGADIAEDEEATFDIQDMGSNEWDVFDAEGRYLGLLAFPARVQPLLAQGERIYGVARDELDVQSLKVYRIIR